MIDVIVLAAGQGTRMRSSLPKVLHTLAGKPLLEHVVDTALRLPGINHIHVVYGHGGELVQERLAHLSVNWVLQDPLIGTGHAVMQAMPFVKNSSQVLVLYGDVPLINEATLSALLGSLNDNTLALLTAQVDDPTGYGRIVRDAQRRVQRIIEQKDAAADELRIREINTGILAAPAARLRHWLDKLGNNNAQGEYYLTDIIAMAVADGVNIHTAAAQNLAEIQGVNDKSQLADLEREYQRQQAKRLMLAGLTLRDPARFDLRGALEHGQDVVIDANVILEGAMKLGNRVQIGAGVVLKDCTIGDDVIIEPFTVIDNARIEARCHIGPYARIRPETHLAEGAKVGNFVELKKSNIGRGSKVNHLSYVGDTVMGQGVNVGAGTITCNYDGANKHRTIIEDDVFIGSDTQFIAPVRIGAGSTIAAGTTVTKDVAAGDLVLSRTKQISKTGWKRPRKK